MLTLFYVEAEDDDNGDNFDLFVWAYDTDQAIQLWRVYFWQGEKKHEPKRVWPLPATPPEKPEAVHWHKDDGLRPSHPWPSLREDARDRLRVLEAEVERVKVRIVQEEFTPTNRR